MRPARDRSGARRPRTRSRPAPRVPRCVAPGGCHLQRRGERAALGDQRPVARRDRRLVQRVRLRPERADRDLRLHRALDGGNSLRHQTRPASPVSSTWSVRGGNSSDDGIPSAGRRAAGNHRTAADRPRSPRDVAAALPCHPGEPRRGSRLVLSATARGCCTGTPVRHAVLSRWKAQRLMATGRYPCGF
jgi:hypothetical protein